LIAGIVTEGKRDFPIFEAVVKKLCPAVEDVLLVHPPTVMDCPPAERVDGLVYVVGVDATVPGWTDLCKTMAIPWTCW
jgi:hypothetical protein